jgi:hypothetical protein
MEEEQRESRNKGAEGPHLGLNCLGPILYSSQVGGGCCLGMSLLLFPFLFCPLQKYHKKCRDGDTSPEKTHPLKSGPCHFDMEISLYAALAMAIA